jgi:uncharacterized membrane protein (UPF0127 family)
MRVVAAGAAVLILIGCSHGPAAPAGGVVVSFGSHKLGAEVAADDNARAKGLMFRRELGKDAGMLFVFPSTQTCPAGKLCGFWMKNTLIPLSIAFMSRRGPDSYAVIAVIDMQPCTTPRCTVYNPGAPYDATLETNLGWLEAAGVAKGAVARIRGSLPNPV